MTTTPETIREPERVTECRGCDSTFFATQARAAITSRQDAIRGSIDPRIVDDFDDEQ